MAAGGERRKKSERERKWRIFFQHSIKIIEEKKIGSHAKVERLLHQMQKNKNDGGGARKK